TSDGGRRLRARHVAGPTDPATCRATAILINDALARREGGTNRPEGEAVKVHIISDMEGVSGIVKWEQTTGGHPMYEEGRRLYTEEINAAVRGARAGGATEIVVMDCHGAGGPWSFNSMVPELLDPGCEFVVQGEWTEYTAFLEQGCDAALFVGMHARAGSPHGVMNHTVSGQAWQNLWFNGTLVGETGINAALCGTWGCPVLLVTGDDVTCREAADLLGPALTTVAVKQGLGRFSARQIPPVRARQLIEEGARAALRDLKAVTPYNPGKPAEIVVEFTRTEAFDEYRRKPGTEVTGDRTLTTRSDDWWTAWQRFFS
ncbi:MAG: M55 family metallopeptidase, partial [Chloroflexota bacterium]